MHPRRQPSKHLSQKLFCYLCYITGHPSSLLITFIISHLQRCACACGVLDYWDFLQLLALELLLDIHWLHSVPNSLNVLWTFFVRWCDVKLYQERALERHCRRNILSGYGLCSFGFTFSRPSFGAWKSSAGLGFCIVLTTPLSKISSARTPATLSGTSAQVVWKQRASGEVRPSSGTSLGHPRAWISVSSTGDTPWRSLPCYEL